MTDNRAGRVGVASRTGDRILVACGIGGLAVLHVVFFLAGFNCWAALDNVGALFYPVLCPTLLGVQIVRLWKKSVPQPAKYSIVVLVVASVYALYVPSYVFVTRGFYVKIKSQVDADQFQAWAIDYIRTHDSEYGKKSPEELPSYILNMRGCKPVFGFGSVDGQPVITLDYGRGFREWSVMIGEPALSLNYSRVYIIRWKPGIFIVHGPSSE